ncbi:MAG TPA: TOBE domain-containing protein [Streptosporangiaceae bacterium]
MRLLRIRGFVTGWRHGEVQRPVRQEVIGMRRGPVKLSAHNQLTGTIEHIKTGAVMAEITVSIQPGTVTAAITDSSRENLNLREGDQVTVVIKSTEVMIGKE